MCKKIFAFFFTSCLLLIFACNKKETNPAAAFSGKVLTAHAWKIKILYYRLKTDASNTNFTSFVYDTCELDDKYIFTEDSIFIRDDNVVSCSLLPVYFGPWGTGTWSAENNLAEMIRISLPGYYSTLFNVKVLTDESFIIEQATKDAFQNDIVYTYEFEPAL